LLGSILLLCFRETTCDIDDEPAFPLFLFRLYFFFLRCCVVMTTTTVFLTRGMTVVVSWLAQLRRVVLATVCSEGRKLDVETLFPFLGQPPRRAHCELWIRGISAEGLKSIVSQCRHPQTHASACFMAHFLMTVLSSWFISGFFF